MSIIDKLNKAYALDPDPDRVAQHIQDRLSTFLCLYGITKDELLPLSGRRIAFLNIKPISGFQPGFWGKSGFQTFDVNQISPILLENSRISTFTGWGRDSPSLNFYLLGYEYIQKNMTLPVPRTAP